ncbi:MAG: hypothetical protein RQ966_15800 [Acetobacteraceae bacterium]|nr:hypothetical protein [Acetobacteraceae bacterium]
MTEVIAPKIGGITCSVGKHVPAQQKVNGGPSVLYDAVVVLLSEPGAQLLAKEATARDFVADAWAHAKFIAYNEAAEPLFASACIRPDDGGCTKLTSAADVERFLSSCRKVRFWEREARVQAT